VAEDGDILVRVRGVDKVFRAGEEEVYALRGVDLDVRRGEYLSIMGPSGSGKTTLFNAIGALDRPTRGEIRIGEVSLPRLSSLELAYFRCKHIGYVFQTYNLIPFLSALDNVSLPPVFLGRDERAAHRRAAEVLDYVGLGARLHHKPGELSGGQQQRVAIARALANDPAILLADEPTANLDVDTGTHIIAVFKKLSVDFGTTVISATHDHKMLARSDRICWIKGGQVDRIQNVADMNIRVGAIRTRPAAGAPDPG
jgi:putative ABC transport system ATP-binding protein